MREDCERFSSWLRSKGRAELNSKNIFEFLCKILILLLLVPPWEHLFSTTIKMFSEASLDCWYAHFRNYSIQIVLTG